MNKNYDIFIITKINSFKNINKISNKIINNIIKNKGIVNYIENWGSRKLSYTIKKENIGIYILINIKIKKMFINKVINNLKYNNKIIRYITIKKN